MTFAGGWCAKYIFSQSMMVRIQIRRCRILAAAHQPICDDIAFYIKWVGSHHESISLNRDFKLDRKIESCSHCKPLPDSILFYKVRCHTVTRLFCTHHITSTTEPSIMGRNSSWSDSDSIKLIQCFKDAEDTKKRNQSFLKTNCCSWWEQAGHDQTGHVKL